MAARSKAWVCGLSFAGIAGSNPAGGMDVCLLWVLCVVRLRSLRGAGHSSRGDLPSVVCLSMLDNEETLTHWGCCAMGKKTHLQSFVYNTVTYYGLLHFPALEGINL